MNRAAAAEMAAADLAAVVVKGDLTTMARPRSSPTSRTATRRRSAIACTSCAATMTPTGARTEYAGDEWIELPGVAIALLDTAIPFAATGTCRATSSTGSTPAPPRRRCP